MPKIMIGDLPEGGSRSYTSVGIDIGSTTTHLVFSKLTLGFVEEKHKYDIVHREVTHFSEIRLTPFQGDDIDIQRLEEIFEEDYCVAGYTSEDIDTGAIIITGVAAHRHNAAKILELFSDQMGKFVVATAGPNYEAVLAAYGSGAVRLSDRGMRTVMNVDVGGGTTKIAVVRQGEILGTASIYVGARHVVLDWGGRLLRVEEPAEAVATECGFKLAVGEVVTPERQRALAAAFADALFEVVRGRPLSPLTEGLMQTDPLGFEGGVDLVVFSGGVSEYIYGYEKRGFGDLGMLLGEEIRGRMGELPVVEPEERIRATVIGESQYTLQVSGSTNLVTDVGLLPLRNVPVVAPRFNSGVLSGGEMEDEIREAIGMHDLDPGRDLLALAFSRPVINQPSYELMHEFAGAIISVLDDRVSRGLPVVLVFEADIGMGIGRVIQEEVSPGCSMVSIDEVRLGDFNYVDIGVPGGERGLIPVVVKSLVFPERV
jgi:ethanolamine utilization protein EutA